MNIIEDLRNHKLTVIAMNKIIQESADCQNLDLGGSLLNICEKAEVNRTQVYERKKQLEKIMEDLELVSPEI